MSFSSLTFADSGMYQCVAENRHGVLHANAELRVFGESKTVTLVTAFPCLRCKCFTLPKGDFCSLTLSVGLCPSSACAPTFERNPLKKVLAPRNGRVVIECRPKGAPKPTFTWSKDTELLSNSTRWEQTFSPARGQRSGLFLPMKLVTVALNVSRIQSTRLC